MSRSTDMTTHVVSGKRLRETDKAVMFRCVSIDGEEIEDGPKTTWFPFSQVSGFTTQPPVNPEPDRLRVSRWILQQKEMI